MNGATCASIAHHIHVTVERKAKIERFQEQN